MQHQGVAEDRGGLAGRPRRLRVAMFTRSCGSWLFVFLFDLKIVSDVTIFRPPKNLSISCGRSYVPENKNFRTGRRVLVFSL